jgi:hypothetical protein
MKGLVVCAFVVATASLAAQAGQGGRTGQPGAAGQTATPGQTGTAGQTGAAGQTGTSGQSSMMKTTITSEEDYSKAMKEVGAQNGALRKAIASSSEADVTAAATKLEATFKDVQAYWENKKVEDATTAAKNAVAASQAISKANAAHDMAAATTASQTLAAQCMSCHTAHRERLPDGTFKMK